jgi:hypothetical protein
VTRPSRRSERRAIDHYGKQASEILRRHDPLGLIAMGAPEDEYDCVATGVVIELMSEREPALHHWIEGHFDEHFGMSADQQAVAAAAQEFRSLWRSDELAPLRG